ncbi:MAG: GntR family transcriptional regulator [Acidimicrobiia bacterium]
MPRKQRVLSEEAYTEIKRKIVTLELRPGQRIDDHQLSAELSISRTPVREALFRLGSEGLIDIDTTPGFLVKPVGLQDTASLFEAHYVITTAVARMAARRATDTQLDELERAGEVVEKAIADRDYFGITAANASLHIAEAKVAGNSYIEQMATMIHDQGQRLAYLCFGGVVDFREDLERHFQGVVADHRALHDALRRHDLDDAVARAQEHVHRFRSRVQTYLASDAIGGFELSDDIWQITEEPISTSG